MNENTLFKFPCEFPIKVLATASNDLVENVYKLVRRYAPELCQDDIRTRASRNGNYQALTVTIQATSREQLDNIYRALSACDQVKTLL